MTRRQMVQMRRSVLRRTRPTSVIAVALAVTTVSAGCGGDGDETASTTQPPVVTAAQTTIALPTTTTTPTTVAVVPAAIVTDGASVVVANASGIDGAAGRLTDRLAIAGFSTVAATNSSESVAGLQTTQIYYDPAVTAAQAIAESVKTTLGGGAIEVIELVLPALTESGDLGAASVLVLMGNDVADKSLDELQGGTSAVTPTVSAPTSDATSG